MCLLRTYVDGNYLKKSIFQLLVTALASIKYYKSIRYKKLIIIDVFFSTHGFIMLTYVICQMCLKGDLDRCKN